MGKNILFVDENTLIFDEVKKIFKKSEYKLIFAESEEKVFDTFKFHKIDIIFCDIDMLRINALQLLNRIKKFYPSVIRVIVSNNNDAKVVRILENNIAKACFLKTFTRDEIKTTINELFKTQELLSSKDLLFVINSMGKLPTLPEIYIKINRMIEDECDISEIASLIEEDPVMTSRILHIANSAYYRLKTGSVKNAILNLGLVSISNIIVSTVILDYCDTNNSDKEILWKHATLTNKIVIEIYKRLLKKNIDNMASSAGLLHDIGKIILLKNYPQNYKNVIARVKSEKLSLSKVEKEELKISHEEVGAYLLKWWDIPNPIVEAALYSEKPLSSSKMNREIVSVVSIASSYSWEFFTDIQKKISSKVFQYLNINKEDCDVLINEIIEKFEDA